MIKGRDQADRMLSEAMPRGEWVTAIQMGTMIGWPWRVVVRSLMRLCEKGVLESKEHEWKSKRFRVRRTTLYRRIGHSRSMAGLPGWLAPAPRPVVGSRMVAFGDDDQGELCDGPE